MKLNYPAIVVAALVHYFLGAGWFTALAKPWIADLRLSAEEIAYYQTHMTPWPYVIAFICNLILAYGLACVVTRTGDPREHTVGRGLEPIHVLVLPAPKLESGIAKIGHAGDAFFVLAAASHPQAQVVDGLRVAILVA